MAKRKGSKGKRPASAAQIAARQAFAERNRGRKGGVRRGGGGTATLAKHEDRSTPSGPTALFVRGASVSVNKEIVPVTSKRDALAIAMGLLLALRNAAVGLMGRKDDMERLALGWVNAPGAEKIGAHLRGVNLDTEIDMMEDVLGAVPAAAEALGFSGAEWASGWDTITREARLDPIGPVGDEVVGRGMIPPCKGTITTRFSAAHPATDIATPVGTPLRAPEDLVVQSIDRNPGLGLNIVLVSRKEDGEWPKRIHGHLLAVHEGMRYHTFGHLSSVPTDVHPGDKLDAGRVFGYSGGEKGSDTTSTGPHVHWRLAIALDSDGHVKSVPVDPLDLVSEDAITGRGPTRPPLPTWSILDKGTIKDTPSKSVVVHGDVIIGGSGDITSKGGSVDADVGDIGFGLSHAVGDASKGGDPFGELNASAIGKGVGGALGGAVGLVYGGPGGARIGGKLGSMMGQGAGKLGSNVFDSFFKQGSK